MAWRRTCATREGEEQQAHEHQQQPALDADARGRQPAPRGSHRPLELAVEDLDGPVPCSRSQSASSSAMTIERWQPPVQPIADRQPALALGDEGRDREVEEVARSCRGTAPPRAAPGRTRGPARSRPDELAQLGDVVRVLHEPDVEHEVGLERHAVLVAEADQLDRHLVRPDVGRAARTAARAARAATRSEVSTTTSASARIGSRSRRSSAIALGDARAVGERVAVAGLREAPDQHLVARLEEEHLRPDPAALERAAHRPRARSARRRPARRATIATLGEPLAIRRRRARRARAAARPGRLSTTV